MSDLSPLEHCKNLRYMEVTWYESIRHRIAALEKALPNCKIKWNGAGLASPRRFAGG